METWRKAKQAKAKQSARTASPLWKTRLLAGVLLLLTLGTAVYGIPMSWNTVAAAANAKGMHLPVLNEAPYRLGLDLQGGTHLEYEADMSAIPADQRDEALSGVRDVIERRVNAFGVSEPVVQTTSTGGKFRVLVELAGVLDVKDAIKQIGETPILEFKEPGRELGRELTAEEQATLATKQAEDRAAADALRVRAANGEALEWQELNTVTASSAAYAPIADAITKARLAPGQVLKQVVEANGQLYVVKYGGTSSSKEMLLSHILLCFEGKTGCANPISALDASVQINNLKQQATPENFADLAKANSVDPSVAQNGGDLGWIAPGDTVPAFELAAMALPVGGISEAVETEFGYHLILKREERPIATYQVQVATSPLTSETDVAGDVSPWKNTELSGRQLANASVQFDQQTHRPIVSITFNAEGGALFEELTARNVGQPIAIFLDGQPISTPMVNQAIYGGSAVIQGDFTVEEAKLLAQRLNAGALPVPIELLSQQTVGPTLGASSLQKSVTAALAGFALVVLFMVLVYRLPGVLASFALLFYVFLNLGAYRVFGVTVTLSGIAGLVLSLGIAVDANVLIFERMKDEFRSGRDLLRSIEEGFTRAWPPIRDGHMTTLISAVVLYGFSSSFVKGFALTLAVGVILSLFTAIVVTRAYLRMARSFAFLRAPWLYGVRKSSDPS